MQKKIILKRKILSELNKWKSEYAPNYALFIKGARRVGKTTIAEEFGKTNYKSYIVINFQEANELIKDLFVNSLLDLDYFFNAIQLQYKKKLYPRNSLIVLDEIQLFPKARQALKTLLKDGRYDYIETGSLAGITKKSKNEEILIPSEEYTVEMFPLDFEEFLAALGDDITINVLREHFDNLKPLNKLHNEILKKFRIYMCVGGMPQAVIAYLNTKDFEKVDFVKKEILELYRNDIKEQKEENYEYVGNILENIPSELGRHDSSSKTNIFCISHLNKNARLRDYQGALRWLDEAMIVNVARNTLDPSPALTLNLENKRFKCYMMDTGLLINLSFNDSDFIQNDLYQAILLDKLHINEGMFIENIVAQSLKAAGHKIIFYVEYDNYNKLSMEIDFIIRKNRKIIPIEVKSSRPYKINSLLKFKQKFSNKVGNQIVLHDADIKRENEIIYLPYYMSCFL
ncbi:MAG: AAA family ATPase [Alphaproteobacteria bacterium]|nr:AAA family ATPase [Alphaproteobacteria bacterium]